MQEEKIVDFVASRFEKLANSRKAVEMAAYMKTTMPFYGIQKPDRLPIYKQLKKQFQPLTKKEYEENIRLLWRQPHREEKYTALEYATFFPAFITSSSLPLYEEMIRQGQWWDFVDVIATKLVGYAFLQERQTVEHEIERFATDDNLWIRRTAILSQNGHKERTDQDLLFRLCLDHAGENEFFIRKAIGWALRQYSYVAPEAVRHFLEHNRSKLSRLSYEEARKALARL